MAAAGRHLMRAVFGATVLLGAFLLFQVQPLLSRWILPWFGGGPAVWTTCMLFFQAVLFAGYAYAHGSRRLPSAARTGVHLALVAGACAMLPVAPSAAGMPEGVGNPTWPILKLLGATVGLPCLLLSSTGPLVQAWAARTNPEASPYRLYALSNAGSLAALLSYPFVVEPRWGLRAQSAVWTWTFAAYAALFAAGAVAVRRRPAEPSSEGRGFRAAWVVLPAVASALLLAVTNQLSQDIAVLPFLWVLPLTAYLVSFIVVFEKPEWYRPEYVAPLTALAAFGSAVAHYARPTSTLALTLTIAAELSSLMGVCLLCHGELARIKPAPGRLTGYYLAVAGGGALGGLLVSVVAPLVFSTYFEGKLGIGLAYVGAWAAAGWIHRGWLRAHLNLAACGLVAVGIGFAFLVALLSSYATRLDSSRNFFGAVSVDVVDKDTRDLMNGRVLHGRQHLDAARRRAPTTYYAESSGVGRAIKYYAARPDLRVGVVGLGVGTVAAYASQPAHTVRFYEINPDVPRIARRWFTYLEDCAGKTEVVLGDARLSLERESPQGYHVLALDAFSGHTVPTHLLTVEAMRIYERHVRDDGAIAVHVSNQFLRLGPVVRGAARRCGLKTLRIDAVPNKADLALSSAWVLCTRNEAALREWSAFAAAEGDVADVVWTDDESDLLSILEPR